MSEPGAHRRHRASTRRQYWPAALMGVKIVASLLSVFLLAAFGYGWYSYRALNKGTHQIAVAGLGESTAPGATAAPKQAGQTQNILVVGVDSREGLSDAEKRKLHVGANEVSTSTDTIMLIHVPANGKSATLVSIPRDTYVDIPGHPSNKINAAYADGYYDSGAKGSNAQQSKGASLLVATVRKLTGVPIDHYVQVGFAGFEDIVKVVGNIPVDLCADVDDTVKHNAETGVGGGSGFKMSAGHHSLNPVQALEFVRQRHNFTGPVTDDFARELRQRYFLSAAFKAVLSGSVLFNPLKLNRLITAVDNAFVFGGSGLSLEKFAEQMSDLSSGNIKGQSIPTTGGHSYGGAVGDAVTVNPKAVAKKVQQLFGLLPTPPPTPSTGPAGAPSGSSGAAGASGSSSSPTKGKSSCIY